MKTEDMQQLFRCSLDELKQLKTSLKQHMLDVSINGRSLLGQLPSQVDPYGVYFEDLWHRVAASRAIFDSMLSGSRWVGRKPPDFDRGLRRAKAKMMSDFTAAARRKRCATFDALSIQQDSTHRILRAKTRGMHPEHAPAGIYKPQLTEVHHQLDLPPPNTIHSLMVRIHQDYMNIAKSGCWTSNKLGPTLSTRHRTSPPAGV